MFNLTAPTNIRCNGVVNTASKTTTVPRVQRSPTTSIPSLINKDTTTTHSTLKYVDNNKITSNSCSFLIKKEVSYDDPYAFHDSEVNLLNSATLLKKQLIKTEPPQSSSPNNKNNVHNININNTNTNTTTTTLALLNPNLIKSEKQTNNNNDGGGGVCSKTMNKLQAQIARHKVNVKHKKEISPVPNNITKIESSSVDVKPSIIDISDNNSTVYRKLFTDTGNNLTKTRRVNLKTTHHETLQRIRTRKRVWHAPYQYGNVCDAFSLSDTDDSDMDEGVMTLGNINHWSTLVGVDREMHIQRNRERMARALYKQKLERINDNMNCHRTIKLIGAMQGTQCSQIANIILQQHSRFRDRLQHRSSSSGLLPPRQCSYDGDGGPCKAQALPCTRHCGRHIMYNSDQLLYDYCTAKFADNTQCCIPVFDLNHELPLCIEHARKRDNYNKMCQVVKPKKPRKKVKPSAMIRPQKRSKKRKRPSSSQHSSSSSLSSQHHHVSKTTSNNHLHQHQHHDKQHVQLHSETKSSTDINVAETSSACDSSDDLGLSNPLAESTELSTPNHFGGDEPDDDMVAQVLGVGEELPLELAGPAEALVNQASRLLEETDLTNVFNQIPPDAFNDLFAIDRNGVYEPTREETEELERALEAVNQDVKSLEKMSQTQGILDSLLDEHALVESLAHMPDVFPNLNGFSVTSSSSVAQTVSSTVPTVIPSRIHNLDNIISVQQPPAHMPS
ncbi:INO80 complex subunit D-B isoform X2 [Chrysoperla carnea]|uniref:INO80 complex subunit D-B isoform X2 n=1 Tax=Chrysoperla carnea TaxID=189513 RepID=UPI001D064904|nr:INO80 complex subunit D-B isoform X2 [Chrysoperla carnea]